LQHGLIGLHRLLGGFVGRDRLIDLLLRGDLLGEQLLLAYQVAGGLRKCGVVLCELRLVAGYEGLDLTIVEGEEQIALPDELTVRDMLLQHLAVDARADNDDCGRFEDADGAAPNDEIPGFGRDHDHRHSSSDGVAPA